MSHELAVAAHERDAARFDLGQAKTEQDKLAYELADARYRAAVARHELDLAKNSLLWRWGERARRSWPGRVLKKLLSRSA